MLYAFHLYYAASIICQGLCSSTAVGKMFVGHCHSVMYEHAAHSHMLVCVQVKGTWGHAHPLPRKLFFRSSQIASHVIWDKISSYCFDDTDDACLMCQQHVSIKFNVHKWTKTLYKCTLFHFWGGGGVFQPPLWNPACINTAITHTITVVHFSACCPRLLKPSPVSNSQTTVWREICVVGNGRQHPHQKANCWSRTDWDTRRLSFGGY